MTLITQHPQSRDYSTSTTTTTQHHMAPYQPQPPVAQGWDRWQHSHANSDYTMLDNMASYDPRTVPSNTILQRPPVTTQYQLPTTYAESPITPLSASPYGSQGHFNDYPAYTYEAPAQFPTSLPVRTSHRPTAPPTPPMDEDRGIPLSHRRRASSTRASLGRRSPRRRRSISIAHSVSVKDDKSSKDCKKLIKNDGSLQYESGKSFDVMLRGWESLMAKKGTTAANTPESAASPGPEEDEPKARKRAAMKCRCEVCGKLCAQEAQLKTHMRSHNGEKPYVCPHAGCGFRCSQPGNLRSHQQTHTQEKPYKCDLCDTKFASNGGKKVHIATKHEGKPKEHCPIYNCPKSFSTIGNMKQHIDRQHTKEVAYYIKLIEDSYFNDRPFPEEHLQLMTVLARVYKNSNCGIKGRGPDSQETKEKKEREKAAKRELEGQQQQQHQPGQHQEMTPVSPEATNTLSEFRNYYDQQHQQHYQVAAPLPLPNPPQHHQQQHHQPPPPPPPAAAAGYLQLPIHAAQPASGYHALPTPAYNNMSWTHGPQYH